MRAWLRDIRSYIEPVKLGDVMRAAGLATVVAAGPSSKFRAGDVVYGVVGWQEYAVVGDKELHLVSCVLLSGRWVGVALNSKTGRRKEQLPLTSLGPLVLSA
jgi:NADPH-dependent curcumin reductase CurA